MISNKIHVKSITFKLNIFNFEQSWEGFWFRTFGVGLVASLAGIDAGPRKSSGYYYDMKNYVLILMKRLSEQCPYHDLDFTRVYILDTCLLVIGLVLGGLKDFALSNHHDIATLCHDMMSLHLATYAPSVDHHGTALKTFVALIYYIKIHLGRPGRWQQSFSLRTQ